MSTVRLIARLDIKGPNLIKGVHLEGLRVIGDPQTYARRYYEDGADELLYMDAMASLYNRNNLAELLSRTARDVFIPITAGGGIRTVEDAARLLRSGADKVAVNTAAVRHPELITELAERFGRQAVVLSIEAKRRPGGDWEAYVDNGREHTGLTVEAWAQRGEALQAGEILLTSIDREGTRRGFDTELVRRVTRAVSIPVILSGGMGSVDHLCEAVDGGADAVAMADILHYDRSTLREIRARARDLGVPVRRLPGEEVQ